MHIQNAYSKCIFKMHIQIQGLGLELISYSESEFNFEFHGHFRSFEITSIFPEIAVFLFR